MAETDSEKMVKYTLRKMLEENEVIYFQKVCTPKYQAEPIDFLAVTPDGRSHLIEVKENSGHSIPPSQFKDHQQEYLTRHILNDNADEQSGFHTRAWVIARFYRDDVTKQHTNYFEQYFLCPGYYASPDKELSVNALREAEDATYLGGWKHGGWELIAEGEGKTKQGNDKLGFRELSLNK